MSRSKGAYLETGLIESKAFKSLTKAEILIYFEFLLKRQFGKYSKKNPNKAITNNGKIIFTYREAEKLGFPRPTFRRAIDKFIETGLVDLAKQGHGGIPKNGKITGESNEYAVSERWKLYGADNFKIETRKKDTRAGRGWAAYHAKKRLIYGKD